ncbi:ComEC/Rec2 family competence protein [Paenarthrobacter sp. RAF54_2]|uniref:ComEC/Rec2 family competence protein n=1 Tax=Paenarthrobacter sp. RAF54_2 TaxID=3233061 RepID=UPI003F979E1F
MAEDLERDLLLRRLDLRLVPAVLFTWAAALAGSVLTAAWSATIGAVLAAAASALLFHSRLRATAASRARTVPATLALACVLGAVAAGHCALAAGKRDQGPLGAAVDADAGVVIQVRVTGSPSAVPQPGHSSNTRWSVPANLVSLTTEGNVIRGSASLIVIGDDAWQDIRPGQRVRTTGTLKEVRPGQSEAAILTASTKPVVLGSAFDLQDSAAKLREQLRDAASWLPPDAAGLLPGMVTGDTSALPESLEADMKTTGMVHLTAVSGANCSLILGGFILLARCLRLARPPAAAFAGCGLGAFVVLVGPEPSVLRAAVMGFVGMAALTGGLRGRPLTFLCLATVVLLLLDPTLASNFGFLLSVLATLGIVLLASRIASWFPDTIPKWLAVGVSVPLSAQVLCGPVIAALQPQFSPYALIANVIAGPLVAPITILGTLSVPLSAIHPLAAAIPIALAGGCASGVAGIARFFAGLPGAALPWAEGPAGIVAMSISSVVTVVVVWTALHPGGVLLRMRVLHHRVMVVLERLDNIARRK